MISQHPQQLIARTLAIVQFRLLQVRFDYLDLAIAGEYHNLYSKTYILVILHILCLFALETVLLDESINTILYPMDSKKGTGLVWKWDF